MVLNLIYTIVWGLFLSATMIVHIAVSAVLLVVMLPFDKARRTQCRYSRFIARFCVALSPWMRVKVEGIENINPHQHYLIVSNHRSMLDILFMYMVPLRFKWVSKREVYRIPLVGQLLWLHGDITIKRGDAASVRRMLAECTKWLQCGMSIVIFPEGTRSKTGEMGAFKEGAFILAKKNSVPLLPVVLDGTSTGSRWLLSARQRVRITILPPVGVEELHRNSIRTLTDSVRTTIAAERTRQKLLRQHL